MKTEALDKKHEKQDNESIFENYEIILTEKEAENLVKRLEKGPARRRDNFLKNL